MYDMYLNFKKSQKNRENAHKKHSPYFINFHKQAKEFPCLLECFQYFYLN